MRVREITSLSAVDADALRESAVAGDNVAKTKYAMYSAWRKIQEESKRLNSLAGYRAVSPKDEKKVLLLLGREIGVQWRI